MTVKDICKVHYLSCVEAYFGAWIKEYISLPVLYAESYLPWNEIVKAFEDPAVNYTNFPYIPRIQDYAERVGIVTHRKEFGIPKNVNHNDLLLVSVNENFFSEQKPWRRDHYIAAEITDKKIKYCNEYPLESGEMKRVEFEDKFGGESLVYSFVSADFIKAKESGSKQAELIRQNSVNGRCGLLPIIRLRDAIGILRVSRKRTVEWLDWQAGENFVHGKEEMREKLIGQIRYADNIYFRLQSVLIRNGQAGETFLKEITERIAELDKIV